MTALVLLAYTKSGRFWNSLLVLAISDIPQIAPTAHARVDVHHDEVRRAQVEQREVAKRVDLEGGAARAGSRCDVQKNSKARWEVVCVEKL